MSKRGKIVAGILAFLVIGGIANSNNNPATSNASTKSDSSFTNTAPQVENEKVLPAQEVKGEPAPTTPAPPAPTPAPTPPPAPAPTPAPSSGLSNDNYYTNSAGNTVHSPAYSDTVPAGATAQCKDGTYSFSQSRRGTCSGHGGVASWL